MYLYKELPVLQDDKYLLLFNNATDANDFIMAFDKAKNELPLENDEDNHYLAIAFKRMKVALNSWEQAHKSGWYFRWTIIDKTIGDTIGILEEIKRADDEGVSNYVWLKIDFLKKYECNYENVEEITHILSLIANASFDFFTCEKIAIKIPSISTQRINAVTNLGFNKLQKCPIKHDGTQSYVYYFLNKLDEINNKINKTVKNFMIYFSNDSDLVEQESIMKEWRGDVLVSYNGLFYQLDFITINRINKEYESARCDCRTYELNNTVVVENMKRDTIIQEVIKIVECDLIKSFSTIDLQRIYCNTFPELKNINNWIRVY